MGSAPKHALFDPSTESLPEGLPRDGEARLRMVLDASGMGTFIWNLDTDRGEPDARAVELFGLTDVDVSLHHALDAIIPPEDRARCGSIVARALDPAGDGRLQADIRVRRPGGGQRWLAVTARATFAGDPRRAIRLAGVVSDIDDRKRGEASLAAHDAMLAGDNQRKDEFLAVLAHELRNPLAPIRAGLEFIRLTDTSAAIGRTREIMERQVGHMIRLIDDLLDVSRITSGKIQLQRRPTALESLVGTAIDAHRAAIAGAGLRLDLALPKTPVWLDVDPTRLVQVISNVLHNAVKFTDTGGRIGMHATVEHDAGGSPLLRLAISDTGIGLSPAMQPRIFDLFTQDRAASARSRGGLGIGLALARRLVEMHGGRIDATSDGPGRGSTFTIRLPATATAGARGSGPVRAAVARSAHRVVVVDDNVDAADAMAMLIAAHGGEARVAGDGTTGLAAAIACRATLVLLDIEMPGIDGYETCRRLREALGGAVTIVALTGWGQEHHIREADRAGFDAHLIKPADPAAVARLLAAPPRTS